MSEQFAVGPAPAATGWRPKLGLLLFVLAVVSPLLVPLVAATGLEPQARRALAGLLLCGLPMALMLAVVALVGRPAYAFIKSLMPAQDEPPVAVGLARYRSGLVLVLLGILVSWLEPVLSPHFPALAARRVLVGTLADGLVLVGLFVLGADFWDKFRALFVHDARVVPEPGRGRDAPPGLVRVNWRFYAGIAILVCSFGSWSLVPIASSAGWSTAQIASLSGAIFIGVKVGVIAAIAVMGRDGFNYLKLVIGGFLSRFAPPRQVGAGRYKLGLLLFLVPVLMTWIAPYVGNLLQPGSVYGFLQELSLEVLLLVGLFVLGGEFWEKLGALFRHRAQVEFGATVRG
jgi:hypothetical protein